MIKWIEEIIEMNNMKHPLKWLTRETIEEIAPEYIQRMWERRGRPEPGTTTWVRMWDDITLILEDMIK